ncbi:hypothetical protein Ahy_B01g052067 [Arachis hypogaea]|uniref:RNase H type-1 domain-containing protein n=1 Tax=Arachis hypogaea TaxID=3818 RepID=A0A445ANM7_ARAHY|nr:hypothetical protein Ahy_B01g052067 [Arachis hypogaea]
MSLTKERSPRVSPQEEDLMNHSTKKVKTHNDAELGDNVNRIQPAMDVELGNENQQSSLTTRKVSYKDSLVALGNSSMAEDDIDENDPNSEDKWYKDKESNGREEKPFDLCPVIPVSKEEFEEWCKPWQAALIVKVLGKRVNLGFIEHRLNRDWERKNDMVSNKEADANGGQKPNEERIPEDTANVQKSRDNQDLPNFRPWMMVRKPQKRKQDKHAPVNRYAQYGKVSISNKDRAIVPSEITMEKGSRYNALYEENGEEKIETTVAVEDGIKENIQNGLDMVPNQKENGAFKRPTSKVLRPGAGKNPQGEWDNEKLKGWLPDQVVQRIIFLSPPSPWKQEDHLVWAQTSDGTFNLKTTYQAVKGDVLAMFEKIASHPNGIVESIHNRVKDILKVIKNPILPGNKIITSGLLIRWYPPVEGFIKINVDGSFLTSSNNATCGGVMRDSLGRFIKCFSCNLGSCSIMHAELWTIVKGLHLAVINSYNHVVIESDSMMAIQFIKEGMPKHHPCYSLVEEIQIIIRRLNQVNWSHTLREANCVADFLAKMGHDLSFGLHTFESPPRGISTMLYCDNFGSLRLRGSR